MNALTGIDSAAAPPNVLSDAHQLPRPSPTVNGNRPTRITSIATPSASSTLSPALVTINDPPARANNDTGISAGAPGHITPSCKPNGVSTTHC